MLELRGLYTAITTPFLNNAVDEQGLRRNVRFQLQAGVDGIVPLGTTGETPTLSRAEQAQVLRIAVEEARGKATVIAGAGSNSTAQTIDNARAAKEAGADGVLIVTPYYNKPTPEGIFLHFKAVVEAVDIPVVIYNIAGRTGTNIDTALMERLSELPHIVGVKEASGSIAQMGEVLLRVQRRRPDFTVLSGDDAMTLPLLALGGRGVISVASNLIPAQMRALTAAGLSGDFAAARELHFRLLPLFQALFIETNPIPIKTAMELCGMPAGGCRLPLCAMSPRHRETLADVLRRLELL